MLRPTMLGYVALNVAIVWLGLYDDFKNCANRNYANFKNKREENEALDRFLFGLVFVYSCLRLGSKQTARSVRLYELFRAGPRP